MNLIKTLPTDESFDQIIYIGAGELQSDDISNIEAKKLTLVEAHPEIHSELIENFEGWANLNNITLNFLNESVDKNEASKTFNLVNLPEMSGLNLPSGLFELYPGLKVLESEKVQTTSLESFLSSLDLSDSDDKNLLLIDIPAQIDELLSAFLESTHVNKINAIQFTKSAIPLADEEISIEESFEKLKEHGFELISKENTQEDFVIYRVNKNPLFDELKALKIEHESTLKEQSDKADSLTSKVKTLESQLTEEIEEKMSLTRALEKEVSSLTAEKDLHIVTRESEAKHKEIVQNLTEQLENLETEHQQLIQDRNKFEADLRQQLNESKEAFTVINSEKVELETSLKAKINEYEELQTQLVDLTSQHDGQSKLLTEIEQRNDVLKVENAELVGKQTELENKLEELAQALQNRVSALSSEKEAHENTRESEVKHKDWAHDLKDKLEKLEVEHEKLVQDTAQSEADLSQQLKENTAALNEVTSQKAAIEDQLNSTAEENKTLQSNLDETTKQLEEKSKWLAEHEQWNACLKKDNTELANKVTALEDKQEGLIKQAESKDKEIANKSQKLQEQQYRNERLEQEVVKLEAQLELIKDVILREKAF